MDEFEKLLQAKYQRDDTVEIESKATAA